MSGPPATIVLDSEAVQAFADERHPKHAQVIAMAEVENRRGPTRPRAAATGAAQVVVPVAVRVEAGWDRTARAAARLHHLTRAADVTLDGRGADRAARWRASLGVSVVDATVIEAADRSERPVAILTSDVDDLRRAAALLDGDVRVVRI